MCTAGDGTGLSPGEWPCTEAQYFLPCPPLSTPFQSFWPQIEKGIILSELKGEVAEHSYPSHTRKREPLVHPRTALVADSNHLARGPPSAEGSGMSKACHPAQEPRGQGLSFGCLVSVQAQILSDTHALK